MMGVGATLAVVAIFGLPAAFGFALVASFIAAFFGDPDTAGVTAILGFLGLGFPFWFIASIGAVAVGLPVTTLAVRFRLEGRWTFVLVGAGVGASYLWLVGFGYPILHTAKWPPVVETVFSLGYGAAYGLLFWYALRWIRSRVIESNENWSKRSLH